jgi:hypothetical protein
MKSLGALKKVNQGLMKSLGALKKVNQQKVSGHATYLPSPDVLDL